jgi:hypothetical protein
MKKNPKTVSEVFVKGTAQSLPEKPPTTVQILVGSPKRADGKSEGVSQPKDFDLGCDLCAE